MCLQMTGMFLFCLKKYLTSPTLKLCVNLCGWKYCFEHLQSLNYIFCYQIRNSVIIGSWIVLHRIKKRTQNPHFILYNKFEEGQAWFATNCKKVWITSCLTWYFSIILTELCTDLTTQRIYNILLKSAISFFVYGMEHHWNLFFWT